MPKKSYIGVSSQAKNISDMYIGVNGQAKKVKKGYIGVGGLAKLFYESGKQWKRVLGQPDDGRYYLQGFSFDHAGVYVSAGGVNGNSVELMKINESTDILEQVTRSSFSDPNIPSTKLSPDASILVAHGTSYPSLRSWLKNSSDQLATRSSLSTTSTVGRLSDVVPSPFSLGYHSVIVQYNYSVEQQRVQIGMIDSNGTLSLTSSAQTVYFTYTTDIGTPGISYNGLWVAAPTNKSPYVTVYANAMNSLQQRATITDLGGATSASYCAFTSDGVYLAVATNTSPFFRVFKREGTSTASTFTLLPVSSPVIIGGPITSISFDKSDTYLLITSLNASGGPTIALYERNGDTFVPVELDYVPKHPSTGGAFSGDSRFIITGHDDSPFIVLYKS